MRVQTRMLWACVLALSRSSKPFSLSIAPEQLRNSNGTCWFNRTLESYSCTGLQRSTQNCSEVDGCRQTCCASTACNTYQFNEHEGCWLGHISTSSDCKYDKEKTTWIGEGFGKSMDYNRSVYPAITATYPHDPNAFTQVYHAM